MAERSRGQDLRGRQPGVNQVDCSAGGDWRTLRPPAGPSAAGRQFAWRQHKPDNGNLSDATNKLNESGMELSNGGGYSSDGGASSSSGKRSNLEVEVPSLELIFPVLFVYALFAAVKLKLRISMGIA